MPNRLAHERSPYLLQHQDNPVDWFPWGPEAFERAHAGDRPIFLSIGYSTCHWCHVMAHESFENPAVAAVLNEHFVSIKVDREERPDVDRVYMAFVQLTTGSGGWPMSVWLTPSLEPFYGGTYFPPTSRWGRPGFVDILHEIARVWREERGRVETSASSVVERLRTFGAEAPSTEVPGVDTLEAGVRQFAAAFDARRGGFGDAPKFPRPSELLFLLREHARTGSEDAREMALRTLRAMALGGMRDHLGGGFHRYSVDGGWRVPHFEKMLYDQAQLVLAYLDASQASGDPFFAEVAADTLAYVARDMTDPLGGFYSAEDADSVPPEQADAPAPHTMEGAFYIWRDDEIGEVTGPDGDVFRRRFGIEPHGNAPFDPQQEFVGKNLLYTAASIDDIGDALHMAPVEVEQALARARAALAARRVSRPRPHLDDKILTAWNGLMIAAFARGARVLGDDRWLASARRAALFVWTHLWQADSGTLLRRYRSGEAAVDGFAEDYAYLVFGLLELFQADGDPRWLEWALAVQREQDARFLDAEDGGWFSTTGRDASVLLRQKEDYDGAEPSATSVAVWNALTLSRLMDEPALTARAEQGIRFCAARLQSNPRTVPMMLAALSTYHAGGSQLVVAGAVEDTAALRAVARQRYLPFTLNVPVRPEHREPLSAILPWTRAMNVEPGRARAFVCQQFACGAPVSTPDALAVQLS